MAYRNGSWHLKGFLALGAGMATLLSVRALAGALRSAFRGDRLAWIAMAAPVCIVVGFWGWQPLPLPLSNPRKACIR